MSAAERTLTRDQTLAELATLDLHPIISLNAPTPENADILDREADALRTRGYTVLTSGAPNKGYGGKNNILGARAAVRYALERDAHLFYCEDDIQVGPLLPWALEQAASIPDAVTWMYAHDGRGDKMLGARYGLHVWRKLKRCLEWGDEFPRGLYRIRDHRNVNSGQAILFPIEALRRLPVEELDVSASAFDMWTQDRVNKVGLALLVALPHPVQHTHDRTGRSVSRNPNKSSQSYGMRWR
jgi:hypothetical protein